MNCVKCGIESKTRFCSDKCRKADYRDRKNALESNMGHEMRQGGTILPPESGTNVPEVGQFEDGTNTLGQVGQTLNKPENYGLDNCQCKHCQQIRTNKSTARLNHGEYMTATELEQNGYDLNRVTLPGDIDYNGALTGGLTITN